MLFSRTSSVLHRMQKRFSTRKLHTGDPGLADVNSRKDKGSVESERKNSSLRVVNSLTRKLFFARKNSVGDIPINVSVNEEIIGELVIMVQDDGCGISKEHQSQIFQEGIQLNPDDLKGRGNTNGSGFGLFISKSIV